MKKSLKGTWAHTFLIWWHKSDHVSTMRSIIHELQNRVTHYDVTNRVTNSFLLFFELVTRYEKSFNIVLELVTRDF